MTLVQQEPKSIKLGKLGDYSAMQGPAPDGFHVPLTTEWQAVYDIWTALGGGISDGINFSISLKLPLAGERIAQSATADYKGTFGRYWTCKKYSSSNIYRISISSTNISVGNELGASGMSIRPFKNTYVVPTLTWTKLYGTSIEAGGIFWNSTDGLISLSSDGQTWITIADKNLGATTVWNSGDTLSEANCGGYFQRGNNYMFPFTGSVTNNTTKVDVSGYGPGNYYSSSTFIRANGRWDEPNNDNLRGGVTGAQPLSIKKVYLGSNQVRPQNVKFVKSANTITASGGPNALSSIGFSSIGKKILTSIYTGNNIYYGEASTSFPTTGTISFNSVNYGSTVRGCGYINDSYFWVGNDSSVTLYSGTPSSRVSQGSISTAGRVRGACASPDGKYFYVADNQTNLKSYSLSTARNLSTATNTGTITTSNVRMLCYINDYKGLGPCVATLGTNFINVYKLNNNSISSAYIIANQTQSRGSSIYGWFVTPDCSKLYITVFNDKKIYVRENQN